MSQLPFLAGSWLLLWEHRAESSVGYWLCRCFQLPFSGVIGQNVVMGELFLQPTPPSCSPFLTPLQMQL